MRNRRFRRIVRIGVLIGFSLFVLYFLTRTFILNIVVKKAAEKLLAKTGFQLTVQGQGFTGFRTVWMSGMLVVNSQKDTLLTLDSAAIRPSVFSLLSGNPGISFVHLEHGRLSLVCREGKCNYQPAGKLNPATTDDMHQEKGEKGGFAELIHKAVGRAFALAPQEAKFIDLRLRILNDSIDTELQVPEFFSTRDAMAGTVVEVPTGKQWQLTGSFSQRKETIDLTIYPEQNERELPLFREISGGSAGFDTLHLALYDLEYHRGKLQLVGHFSVEKAFLHHSRLATDTIRLDHARFDYQLHVTSNSIELDTASQAIVNSMLLRPYFRLEKLKALKIAVNLRMDSIPASDFFASLPEGMFNDVRSIRADGNLTFRLDFMLNAANPDSVVFHCDMKKNRFRIRDFGTTGLLKLNSEFIHEVYERDRYIRSFPVGPSNPWYTTLDQVSPNFRNAVLTSEDGNFYFHNGFNEEAFRKSIAANYKAGKFVRGGSTISMQLVKNVFLTRKKTVARKAEEALFVWLIESNRLVSKDRLLEVYFNIIELGPDVYGIGEASQFYFAKKPSQLDLAESIYLAGLLPRPKGFKHNFDTLGNLKPYVADYYRVMSNFMLRKNLITQADYDALKPQVSLTGPARDMVMPVDTNEAAGTSNW